ncbi:MAG: hypothetical protein ABSE62_11830 [Chthoniobacteraceae bacterium]|jgi:hypothetical protein
MKTGLIIATIAFSLGLPITLTAADPAGGVSVVQGPLPDGPLLKRAPDNSQWRVIFTYGPGPIPAGTNLVLEADVIKTKPFWNATVIMSDSTTIECWGDGNQRYEITPTRPAHIFKETIDVETGVDYTPESPFVYCYDKTDFPDFDWVSAKTFIGYDKSRTYLVFQQSPQSAEFAWIDEKTRLPVLWQKDKEVRQFIYGATPTTRLVLPPNVQKVADIDAQIHRVYSWRPGAHASN